MPRPYGEEEGEACLAPTNTNAMAIDLNNLLHSLVRYISTGTALPYSGAGRALYVWQMVDEATAAAVKSCMRIYGGPGTAWEGMPGVSVQVETIGLPAAALSQSQRIFEALSSADGRPLQGVTINGYKLADNTADGTWRLASVRFLGRPGQAGMADVTRARIVFSMDVYFARPAA